MESSIKTKEEFLPSIQSPDKSEVETKCTKECNDNTPKRSNTLSPMLKKKLESNALSPMLKKKLEQETIEARAQRLTPEVPDLEKLRISYSDEFDTHDSEDEGQIASTTVPGSPLCSPYCSPNKRNTWKTTTFLSPALHRSPSLRRLRVRTMEKGQCQLFGIASTERMKRNTDSMLEDVIIAKKLKRRLSSRREVGISRRTVENSSLSDFIKKSVMESSLDALSVVRPTDHQLSHAVDLALNVFLEGYFVDISNEQVQSKARQIFLESLIREEFYDGDFICRQNDIGDKLFVIEEGIVEFIIGDHVAGTAQNGNIFGELSLIYGIPRYASVKAVTQSVMVWSLDALSFRRLQALVAKEFLKVSTTTTTAKKTQQDRLKDFRKQCSSLSDLQEQSLHCETEGKCIDINTLKQNEIIGKGAFGSVHLVSLKDKEKTKTKTKYYALKCMSKASVVERNNKKRVLIEKNVLRELNSIFIISLLGTHQDKSSIYFLTDFVQGGNLMSYMINKDTLSHSECVFFSANIVAALVHIHGKGFVHRDLKPENCLIDKNGYLKLCDFGMAKRLPAIVQLPNGGTEAATLAFTMCGTPEFMAPEFVLSTGYDKGVDLWALGCMLIEMYTGRSPFEFDGDLKKTFREVCLIGMMRKKFSRPDALKKEGLDAAGIFTEGLLSALQNRMGREDSSDLMKQRYYDSIDFDFLMQKKVTAPYLPKISHASDISHFRTNGDRFSEESVQPYNGDNGWCEDF